LTSAPPTHPNRSPLAPEEAPRIGVLERNRLLGVRVGRVVRAALRLASVAVADEPAALRSALAPNPTLLLCDALDLDLALEWATSRYTSMRVAAWTSGEMGPLLEAAAKSEALVALLGVPPFGSMPRPWELASLVRRVTATDPGAPHVQDLLLSGATLVKYRPQSSRDLDFIVTDVQALAERAGASARVAQRAGEVAHELLMNAMSDAPVDHYGNLLYALDRKQQIALAVDEVPTFRFATDGMSLGLQIVDRFGRLTRRHVLDGIARGRTATHGGGNFLDTSAGGAGLGLSRMYTTATSVLVDVAAHRHTSVTVMFDLDIQPREARTVPSSLHLFAPGAGG
jgi:hypothetical protein